MESTVIRPQQSRVFFDPSSDRSNPHLPSRPTDEEIKAKLDDPSCPLNQLVVSKKNEGSMHVLKLFAFSAYSRFDHSCRGMNFGIYAGPGQGKTTVVKKWAETIGIPFIFIQSDALESPWHLFQLIAQAHEAAGQPLQPQFNEQHYLIPPCIVFFDEAHALKESLRTGSLLNAMELNDGWMRAMPPGKNQKLYTIDCQEICWVLASTDPGLIFAQSEAFYSRCTTHIPWVSAEKSEISRMVGHHRPGLPNEACDLVAHYVQNPRKAIAFAGQMEMEAKMNGASWDVVAKKVALINGIDEFGMLFQQVNLLKALSHRPVAAQRLHLTVQCRKEELENMILPYLLQDVEGRGPLVETTPKGYALTRAGAGELEKRGCKVVDPHKVLAEHLR
jgi:Holliday junction resolvasome RuvABC ATP-dependent DNA helicase subunit